MVRLKGSQEIEAYMPFRAKEKWVGGGLGLQRGGREFTGR